MIKGNEMKKIRKFLLEKLNLRGLWQYIVLIGCVLISHLYLQWCQNEGSLRLAWRFATEWHTEKFLLASFVLLIFLIFISSLVGSWVAGLFFYMIVIGLLGFANYQKMLYRTEPIYPDDLKMLSELRFLWEMIGTVPFLLALLGIGAALYLAFRSFYRSFALSKKQQRWRLAGLLLSFGCLIYITDFNNPNNLLRKAYNRTAYWIPYSQKMNYYNTGFIGGFLYNLTIDAMEKPANYSRETIAEIVKTYQPTSSEQQMEKPHIVFVMSESFSDPLALKGITANKQPLQAYFDLAQETYSGKMLSQNYGGGTANIEFEALTGFSMALFNPQMTTPYTMLLPNERTFPSIVSLLKAKNYQATAIHPYNTSMYKRKDVYQTLGFDTFIDEQTIAYQKKIQNNPYISDASAYRAVTDLLKEAAQPQFVHLVTMQTHMPYSQKYKNSAYVSKSAGNKQAINNYMQDLAYSSEAFAQFIQQLKQLDKRTLVVFWGDHLPSIYSEQIQAQNEAVMLHQTEFLFYDTNQALAEKEEHAAMLSPFYFAPSLFDQTNMPMPGFYQLLRALQKELPAFEQGFYYQKGQWQTDKQLTKKQQAIYDAYCLIQYDIVSGEKYSLAMDFFN